MSLATENNSRQPTSGYTKNADSAGAENHNQAPMYLEQLRKGARVTATDVLVEAIVDGVARKLLGQIEKPAKRRLMVVEDAAEYLGFSPAAIRHMVAKGQLPCVRNGRTVRFDVGDLDRWIEERKG